VQLLRGDGEQSLHSIDIIKKRQRELYLGIDRRLQQLEEAPGAKNRGDSTSARSFPEDESASSKVVGAPLVKEPERQDAASGAASDHTDTAGEREAYKKAFNMLKDRRYEDSIGEFKAFLNQYPQSGYAGNAQYWLAEANYVSGDYNNALVEFKKVIDNYPTSPKVPDATLKLGFTHYEMAQWEQARKELLSLRQQYPNSTVARLAEKRLQRMKSEGH
jgi:tol-pal system protein YbgF